MADGRIITFYSYKGGTGRSMALANTAWILASNSKKVLVVDWDLEAPGLQRYFYPFLLDKELAYSDGIINLVVDYRLKTMTPPPQGVELRQDWYVSEANILRYASRVNWDFADRGRLDFVCAGRQDSRYSELVNSFPWNDFFDLYGGAKFFDAVKEHMRQNYDYILIDSRTGVSDTSGICTIQMPDDLVICYTLNNQSIAGASAVALDAKRHRGDSLRVFPVAMRVDNFEKKKLELRTRFAAQKFGPFPDHLNEIERSTYRALAQVPYIPYYAYEELLATFGDAVPSHSLSLLSSIERITGYLLGKELRASRVQITKRDQVLADFEGSEEAKVDRLERELTVFSPDELDTIRRILTRLVRVASSPNDVDDLAVSFKVDAFDDAAQQVIARLAEAKIVIVGLGEVRLADDWRSWQRLEQWINDDRQFLAWRQDFYKDAFSYADSREGRLLLDAGQRAEAEHWVIRRKSDLLPIEVRYIETSRRWRNARRGLIASAAVAVPLLVVAGALYIFAPYRWQRVGIPETGAGKVIATPVVGKQAKVVFSDSMGAVWDASSARKEFEEYAKAKVSPSGKYLLVTKQPSPAETVTTESCDPSCPSFLLAPQPLGDPDFDTSGNFILSMQQMGTFGVPSLGSSAAATITPLQIWRAADGRLIGEIKSADLPGSLISNPFAGLLSGYVTSGGDRLITQGGRYSTRTATSTSLNIPPNEIAVWDIRSKKPYWLPLRNTVDFAVGAATDELAVLSQQGDSYFISEWSLKALIPSLKAQVPLRAQTSPLSRVFWVGDFLLLSQASLLPGTQGIVVNASDLKTQESCASAGVLTSAGGKDYIWCGRSSSGDLWLSSGGKRTVLSKFNSSTADNTQINATGTRLVVVRKNGRAELWNLTNGLKISDLDQTYRDADGNVMNENAGFVSFTLDGNALSMRLPGGAILLYEIDRGAPVAKLDNAPGTDQQVYFDSTCGRANVWTSTGSVLRYAEKKMILGKWFVGSGRCGN